MIIHLGKDSGTFRVLRVISLSLCRELGRFEILVLIVILIVIEYEYEYVNVNVNDARHSACGQRRREMPIPCGENGVDKARDKVFDKE